MFTLRISDETALTIFVASIAVTVLSRILANVRRMPVTVYLISGIISLVPGAGMYNTVYNIISSDYMKAMYTGVDTIKVAVAIAVGIVLVFALPNKMFSRENNANLDFSLKILKKYIARCGFYEPSTKYRQLIYFGLTETMLYSTIGKIEVKIIHRILRCRRKGFYDSNEKIIAVMAVLITLFQWVMCRQVRRQRLRH